MRQAKIHKRYQAKYSSEYLCKYLATTVSFANIFCKQIFGIYKCLQKWKEESSKYSDKFS